MRGKQDKRIFYKSDTKKFGWNKPTKNRNSRKGWFEGKENRKNHRKRIKAIKNELFLSGKLDFIINDIEQIYKTKPFDYFNEKLVEYRNLFGYEFVHWVIYEK